MKEATEPRHASTFIKVAWDLTDYYEMAAIYLDPVIQEFSGAGYNVQVLPVEYEFQLGGDRMLKISKSD